LRHIIRQVRDVRRRCVLGCRTASGESHLR
jgi:hypothetical protein